MRILDATGGGELAGQILSAMETGASAPAILNVANEVAVESFLEGRIGFTSIPALVENVMNDVPVTKLGSLEDVMAQDRLARRRAMELIDTHD